MLPVLVERFYSFAELLKIPRKCGLGDTNFKKLVL